MEKICEPAVTNKVEDPLFELYQIDGDSYPLEGEALILMVRMLDNVEEFDQLSENLRNIMKHADEVAETRILSLFRTLIKGLNAERSTLQKIYLST